MPLISNLKSLLGKHSIADSSTSSSASSSNRKSPEMTARTRESNVRDSVPASVAPSREARESASKEQAEALVRRENAARAKRDAAAYEGLPEGLTLGIKMGDGAFSNVYQASLVPSLEQLKIEPTATTIKVAVKCVRKYELNHSQVRLSSFSAKSRDF